MDNENLGERIKAGYKVATGEAEAISSTDLEELRRKAAHADTSAANEARLQELLNELNRKNAKTETRNTYEARLKWMETPFLILQLRENIKKTVLARYINPKIHASFSPAIKIDVRPGKLVGKTISLEFLISSDSLPKVLSLPASHILKDGANIIMPKIGLKTDSMPVDKYRVSLALRSGVILNSTGFAVGAIEADQSDQFKDVIEEGLSLQDVIDLVDDWQK